MCGITGKIYLDRQRQIGPDILKKMADAIYHRGPDDEGYYINKNVGLGFRRLSIIDLNTGHQPLSNSNESIFIIFNGEIYNFLEHREKLKQKGYIFKTFTDTEVILYLYEEYGVKCLQYLRGMFAFAIWDNNKQELFCARDRFGIKPFYYYTDHEKFVFGSEIKSILASGDIDKSLSNEGLDSYFAFGYITSNISIYKNINKLQPGHYLLLSFKDKATIETNRYWEIKFEPDFSKTENQWVEELQACLEETVKLHMISDVPLGAFLSGGIDSSSVVAMMAKNSNFPIKTFSIGFKDKKYNELEYAREMAKKYGCEYYEQVIEPESISLLPMLAQAYDEPFADHSAIPTYYVSKLAREHVTVALSGDGGDELFAGYDIYAYFNRIHNFYFNFESPIFNKYFWGIIYQMVHRNLKGTGAIYFLAQNKKYTGAHLTMLKKYERSKMLLNHYNKIDYKIASEDFKEGILQKGKSNDFISNIQNLDMQTYMVDDILTKVDRASMLNSLEVRVPLLDHVFAELTLKIPSKLKLNGDIKKYIFKKAMTPVLPTNILNHAKKGFSMPLSAWFKEDLNSYVNDTLLSSNPKLGAYIDKKYLKRIVSDSSRSYRDHSSRIWLLLFFEEWLKQNT